MPTSSPSTPAAPVREVSAPADASRTLTVSVGTTEPRRSAVPPEPPREPGGGLVNTLTISPEDARDQALVLLASRGDQRALTELLTIHQDRVFAVCLRMTGDRDTAEDLAQETLLRVIKSLDQFNQKAKFTTWLTRVAMNVCLSNFRRGKLRRTVSLDAMGDPGSSGSGMFTSGVFRAFGGESLLGTWFGKLFGGGSTLSDSTKAGQSGMGDSKVGSKAARRYAPAAERHPGAEDRAELSESLRFLYAALERLDAEQRALLVLRDMHGMDYHHIAEILGVPQGTVKSRLFRARAALREQYEIVVAELG